MSNPEIEELRAALAVIDGPHEPGITFVQALSNTVAALDAAHAVVRAYDAQVAAMPAPLPPRRPEPRCQHCGVVGGGHTQECIAG